MNSKNTSAAPLLGFENIGEVENYVNFEVQKLRLIALSIVYDWLSLPGRISNFECCKKSLK